MTGLKWLINQVTSEMLSYIRYLSLHNFAPNCIKTEINSCWIGLPSQIWKAKVHPLKKQTKEVCRSCETDSLSRQTDFLLTKACIPLRSKGGKRGKRVERESLSQMLIVQGDSRGARVDKHANKWQENLNLTMTDDHKDLKKPKRFICQESDRLRSCTTFGGVRESSRGRKCKQGGGNLLYEQRDDSKLRTKRNGTQTWNC